MMRESKMERERGWGCSAIGFSGVYHPGFLVKARWTTMMDSLWLPHKDSTRSKNLINNNLITNHNIFNSSLVYSEMIYHPPPSHFLLCSLSLSRSISSFPSLGVVPQRLICCSDWQRCSWWRLRITTAGSQEIERNWVSSWTSESGRERMSEWERKQVKVRETYVHVTVHVD